MKALIIFFILLLTISLLPRQAIAATTISDEKTIYNLPYPGILPDNPLYFLKISRDRVMEFMTRDPMKKAELYLLLADKRAAMSIALSDKGKDILAATTYSKAEKYLEKVPGLVITSRTQGVGPTEGFSEKLKQSVIKHNEVGQTLLKQLPQGQADFLNESLRLNLKIRKEIESL